MAKVLRSRGAVLAGILTLVLVTASCVRPVTGPGSPNLGSIDVTQVGYTQSEFFLYGLADAYRPVAPLTTDGRWQVERDPDHSGVGFQTRMVVHRPADPDRFNGTVVIEWMNVTAGADLPNEWTSAHNEFVRAGAVWIGLSAQVVGVNYLKSCCGGRYAQLNHPGDSYSYDIFSWAARVVRAGGDVLGGLTPQRVIGTGESQSASRLVTYVNAVHPLVDLYDGFLLHSRGASASPLSQSPLPSVPAPSPSLIRDDLDEPVFVVQAEDDVIRSALATRQPDTATFRMWEMAGTAHADQYMIGVGFTDLGDGAGTVRMLELLLDPGPPAGGCAKPSNAGPTHWILQAAFHHLDRWVRDGTPPPVAEPLQVASTSPVVLARDADGNALGGVRSPHVDAPVATVDGLNSGGGFCGLFGSTTPFTAARLAELYPDNQAFLDAWGAAIVDAVGDGFLLPADGWELYLAALSLPVPA